MEALRRAAIVLVIPCLVAALAPPARAQDVAETGAGEAAEGGVAEARRLYAELDFQAAADAAQRALSAPGARELDRARALEILGCALVVLGREESARDAFTQLFRIDPYWRVQEPSGSPRIRRVVELVRSRVADDAAIDPEAVLRLELPRAGWIGRPIELRAVAEGRSIERLVLHVRGEGEAGWTAIEGRASGGGAITVSIPARSEAEELELYAEARDARGRLVTRAGGPLEPERIPVRTSDGERSIAEEPWLWIGVGGGVLVVAAIVIGVAVAGPERAQPGTLPPHRIELPLLSF